MFLALKLLQVWFDTIPDAIGQNVANMMCLKGPEHLGPDILAGPAAVYGNLGDTGGLCSCKKGMIVE